MSKSITVKSQSRKKPGPPATGKGTPVLVRLQPDMLAKIDALRARHDTPPSRPETIRQIVEAAFRLMGDEGLDSSKK